MASSTAFSCFSSSSRRDSVLLGLLEPAPAPEPEPGSGGLPDGAAAPFPDDLGGGDMGRFLSTGKSKAFVMGCEGNGERATSRHTCLPGGAQAGVLGLGAAPSEETAAIEKASASPGLEKNKYKGQRSRRHASQRDRPGAVRWLGEGRGYLLGLERKPSSWWGGRQACSCLKTNTSSCCSCLPAAASRCGDRKKTKTPPPVKGSTQANLRNRSAPHLLPLPRQLRSHIHLVEEGELDVFVGTRTSAAPRRSHGPRRRV